jgi:hypothetical protein
MNIFALSSCPIQSAKWYNNKHCVKQVTEIFQILTCAAIRHKVPEEKLPLTKSGKPAKGGYHFHPCSIWAGNTRGNYLWTCKHGLALAAEYTERYGKVHFCEKGIRQLLSLQNYIPEGELQSFTIAISEDSECRKVFRFNSLNPVIQYRLYYKMDKPHLADWKQNKPEWYDYSLKKILTGD